MSRARSAIRFGVQRPGATDVREAHLVRIAWLNPASYVVDLGQLVVEIGEAIYIELHRVFKEQENNHVVATTWTDPSFSFVQKKTELIISTGDTARYAPPRRAQRAGREGHATRPRKAQCAGRDKRSMRGPELRARRQRDKRARHQPRGAQCAGRKRARRDRKVRKASTAKCAQRAGLAERAMRRPQSPSAPSCAPTQSTSRPHRAPGDAAVNLAMPPKET